LVDRWGSAVVDRDRHDWWRIRIIRWIANRPDVACRWSMIGPILLWVVCRAGGWSSQRCTRDLHGHLLAMSSKLGRLSVLDIDL